MNEAERIRELEAENAHLRARIQQLEVANTQLAAQLQALEARLAKDSHNSHKPPASDGLKRRPRPARTPSQRPNGGQSGHRGHTLDLVATPDVVEVHRPEQCASCGEALAAQPGRLIARRQVFELPPLRMQVIEHQQERVTCPQCAQTTTGTFPESVSGRTQYGPALRALAVYLRMQHLLPVDRTAEVLAAMTRMPIAQASILTWEQAAAHAVAPALQDVQAALKQARVVHTDETGGRIGKVLHWIHVQCTEFLTVLGWHAKRGYEGSASLGVLEHFAGTLIHDRWESYWRVDSRHALCHAHLQRDLQAVYEATQEAWAVDLKDLFLAMHQATTEWQIKGFCPPDEQAAWEAVFWRRIEDGEGLHPRQPGRKQSDATKLLKALRDHHVAVLAFLYDLTVPFTNNQAEQDLRMVKVQQKIAGCWRTEDGATAFCRLRSAISCLRKQGRDILDALTDLTTGRQLSLLPLYS